MNVDGRCPVGASSPHGPRRQRQRRAAGRCRHALRMAQVVVPLPCMLLQQPCRLATVMLARLPAARAMPLSMPCSLISSCGSRTRCACPATACKLNTRFQPHLAAFFWLAVAGVQASWPGSPAAASSAAGAAAASC